MVQMQLDRTEAAAGEHLAELLSLRGLPAAICFSFSDFPAATTRRGVEYLAFRAYWQFRPSLIKPPVNGWAVGVQLWPPLFF
jgi:hypothetical protein